MPDDEERSGLKQLFDGAITHFRETILSQDGASVQECDEGCLPTLMYEGDAVPLIQSRLNRPKKAHDEKTSSQKPSIIGIDLHPNALTLSGSSYVTKPSQAQAALGNADAVIFGYESTGIPRNIDDILNGWVQIPSRSSINLVAAMSIIFDVMFHIS
jgi:hypothetical protein